MEDRAPVSIGFDTRPIPMQITDTLVVAFEADPSNSDGWKTLLSFAMPKTKDAKAQEHVRKTVQDALATMAHTEHDAAALRDANLGLFTLAALVQAYVKVVTDGFPTEQ